MALSSESAKPCGCFRCLPSEFLLFNISIYVSLTQTCPPQTVSRVYTTSARAISVHHLSSFRSEGLGCRRACASKKRTRRSGRSWGKPSLASMSCLFSGDETNNGCKQACLALTESAKPCGYPVAFLLIYPSHVIFWIP